MIYVIGIDGGGTKTKGVLADLNGHVITTVSVGPTNPNTISSEGLTAVVKSIFEEFEYRSPYAYKNVVSIFAGISGAASSKSKKLLNSIIARIVPVGVTVRVEADTVNALYSGTYGKPGMVQICGTGAITYGINQYSEHDRVGGWGYLLGDEGSGYDIGRKGIMAALRFYDGRGKATKLLQNFYEFYHVDNGRELVDKVYHSPIPKQEISSASKVVFQTYKEGDILAKDIIINISKEIGNSIVTLYYKLFKESDNIKVILCGGVFNEETLILPHIRNVVHEYTADVSIVIPKLPPVGGSVIGAYPSNTITNTIIENLISDLE